MRLIVLSGPIGAGKSAFRDALISLFGAAKVSTSAWLIARTGCTNERGALQVAGAAQDDATGGAWVVNVLEEAMAGGMSGLIVLDSARTADQIENLRKRFGEKVFHVHLNADLSQLERRYTRRDAEHKEFATYAEAKRHGTEAQVERLAADADVVLETDYTGADTLAVTAMAMVGIAPAVPARLVDVIVGAQYGSEGKGNICSHIAHNYGALMRIGGPNAGHRVFNPPYKYIQIPSGTGSNSNAMVLIGAGSTLWLPTLLKEIGDHRLDCERLVIDPQAMVIDDWDRRAEGDGLTSIATTRQGVGAASARKIVNRGDPPMLGPPTRLARDVPELAGWVRDVREALNKLYRSSTRVLLEGTQGTALSIHHGPYPHVTSRETSVSGCMADAGISHLRIAKVIMVVRTLPIRVGGPSGWLGRELRWEDVARRSCISVDQLVESEKGTVSNRLRRIAEFDWGQLRQAAELNGATEIAVTFADYLGVENRKATTFAELNDRAKHFISRVEAVTNVPVRFVSKAFAQGGVIELGVES